MTSSRYKHIEQGILGMVLDSDDSGWPTSLPILCNQFRTKYPDLADREVVDALKRLATRHLILQKWDDSRPGFIKYPEDINNDREFFYKGDFRLQRTEYADSRLQELEADLFADQGSSLAPGKLHSESKAQIDPKSALNMKKGIFVGHGRSKVWYQLKDFLADRLGLRCEEFNSESVAGTTTIGRLQTLLDRVDFAFLVMTAEDTHSDNTAHARENVIHEAGLFQGRLGFERAIILLEDGCAQFSNIHGLTHIPFPKGDLEPAFEKIRRVLEREAQAVFEPNSSQEDDPCPKCRKRGWHVEASKADGLFGVLGVSNTLYRCRLCGFSQQKLES